MLPLHRGDDANRVVEPRPFFSFIRFIITPDLACLLDRYGVVGASAALWVALVLLAAQTRIEGGGLLLLRPFPLLVSHS